MDRPSRAGLGVAAQAATDGRSTRVYIAMNRFRVHAGREADFEKVWAERESYLDAVPGFRRFHLLRGGTAGGLTDPPPLDRSKPEARASG